MTDMHGITRFAFVLLAAAAFAQGANLTAAADPLPMEGTPAEGIGAATPNHDPGHFSLMGAVAAAELVAANPVTLRAGPEAAESSAPAFVAADDRLYARANARLRAGPSTAADIVTKLPANAPLRAIARSADGTWWQVALADSRTGYVRRDVVNKYRVAETKARAATAPVAAASPQPVPARRKGLLGRVDEAMNWLVDVTGGSDGSAPKIIRAQR